MKKKIQMILLASALTTLLSLTCFAQSDKATSSTQSDAIVFNFRGAELDEVLDYLSETAGYVIIKEVDVSGTINAWSHQPLTRAEVIELLNSVLYAKGYAAIANGRMLTIVNRNEAIQRQIPTITGSDPAKIPASDRMVTQILPVRYADVEQLVKNLEPLAPDEMVMSVNIGSNAILLTGTQASIRRMAEIIRALDTSISSITQLRVFPLQYSDASELAEVIKKIYEERADMAKESGGRGRRDRDENRSASLARNVQQLVVAVSDTRTNSLVVSAPEEIMPDIADIIAQIDTPTEEQTILRVFQMKYADATLMATSIQSVFASTNASASDQKRNDGDDRRFNPWMRRREESDDDKSKNRSLAATPTVAVADERTNSVIVTASVSTMPLVEAMIAELDSNPAKQKKVFVYSLKNADVANVAEIISQMFEGTQTQNIQRNNVPDRQSSGDMTFGVQNNQGR